MRLFLAHVFQYLPCWDCQWSSWAVFFSQRKFRKMHWKEAFSLPFGSSTQSSFLFCVNLSPGVVCVYMPPPFRDPLMEQFGQKHLEVWQLRSLYISYIRGCIANALKHDRPLDWCPWEEEIEWTSDILCLFAISLAEKEVRPWPKSDGEWFRGETINCNAHGKTVPRLHSHFVTIANSACNFSSRMSFPILFD